MPQQKIDYEKLTTGFEFEPSGFRIDGDSMNKYLDAVDGDKNIYEKDNIVPPMSVAALAMTAMAEGISMPPGAVHVSQDIQFLNTVRINEELTSVARVNRIVKRGKIHMLSIGINVVNEQNTSVLEGETSFILPVSQ
ncbi:MAG: MaoC family dehydratase N-terminal domain-containing protein [Dehalococcoidales bacterium]|nr:MaoC family dehydratase N-terminal domain-containing protein [Dehalococcoidales bacterium]